MGRNSSITIPGMVSSSPPVTAETVAITDVARNIDWRRWGGDNDKMENFCDIILVTFFGDVMMITSLK